MKKVSFIILVFLTAFNFCCKQKKENEWISIFNGKDLDGWSMKFTDYKYGENYLNTFQVNDGKIVVDYDNYDHFDKNFGHLFYFEKLSHYKLRLEYRFVGELVKGAPSWGYKNSGIKFHSIHPSKIPLNQKLLVAIEAQIKGGDGKTERFTGSVCTAGTHVEKNDALITEHCTLTNYPAVSDDSWVKMEIEVYGSEKVVHKINDKVVMKYSNPQYDDGDKFSRELMENGHSRIISEGYFALQAEGHPIEFRNIELMKFE